MINDSERLEGEELLDDGDAVNALLGKTPIASKAGRKKVPVQPHPEEPIAVGPEEAKEDHVPKPPGEKKVSVPRKHHVSTPSSITTKSKGELGVDALLTPRRKLYEATPEFFRPTRYPRPPFKTRLRGMLRKPYVKTMGWIGGVILCSGLVILPVFMIVIYPQMLLKKGTAAIMNHKPDEAENAFKRVLIFTYTKGGEIKAYNKYGETYFKIKAWDEALHQFNLALEVNPKDVMTLNNIVKLYLQQGELSKAEHVVTRIKKIAPRNIDASLSLAKIMVQKGQLRGANEILKYVLILNRKHLEALSLRQKIFGELHEYDKVTSMYRYIMRITKDRVLPNPGILTDAGVYYFKKRHFHTAEELFKEILKHHPDWVEAKYHLARLYAETSRKKQGVSLLDEAIRKRAKYVDAYILYGKILYSLNQPEQAFTKFQQAVLIDPHKGEGYYRLGNICYYELDALLAATNFYEQAIRHGIDNAEVRYNLSVAYYFRGDFSSALQEVKILENRHNDDQIVKYHMGNIYVGLGRFKDAQDTYRNIISDYKRLLTRTRLIPQRKNEIYRFLGKIYNNMGISYEVGGNKKEAVANYWQALEIASMGKDECEEAYRNINRYFKGKSLTSNVEGLCKIARVSAYTTSIEALEDVPLGALTGEVSHRDISYEYPSR